MDAFLAESGCHLYGFCTCIAEKEVKFTVKRCSCFFFALFSLLGEQPYILQIMVLSLHRKKKSRICY